MNCKYCNRECKNANSLRQHEIRCKSNPQRIDTSYAKGWPKGKPREVSSTLGKIHVTDGINNRLLNPDDVQIFLIENPSWRKGFTSKQIKPHLGICLEPDKERLRREKISKTMKSNPQAGGYRKGSGRGKKGWYKDVFCDSSWELAFLVYHLEHNLYIERYNKRRSYLYKGQKHTYIPDFITDDGVIEIKGYITEQWMCKQEQNPDVKILYEKDMIPFLNYVVSKYGNKFWEVLYEK